MSQFGFFPATSARIFFCVRNVKLQAAYHRKVWLTTSDLSTRSIPSFLFIPRCLGLRGGLDPCSSTRPPAASSATILRPLPDLRHLPHTVLFFSGHINPCVAVRPPRSFLIWSSCPGFKEGRWVGRESRRKFPHILISAALSLYSISMSGLMGLASPHGRSVASWGTAYHLQI